MSILSTNTRLIKVGQDYSAGSGISIDNHVISVTSVPGTTYSAGDNIDIYEQDEQLYISSKDWSQDIADASANAYNEATAQIPEPFDPSYISGQIDNKLDSTAFTNWQDGQYATDLQTIEGQISNKLDTSSFSDVSASFLTDINIPESATWNEVSQAYEQASGTYLTSHQSLDGYATEDWVTGQGYITGVDIPESAVWQDVSTTVQSNSAQWSDNTGDEEVNSFVYNNSATINEVDTSYQTNSGNFLTAVNIPESANWNDTTNVVQTNSADWASHQDLSYISGVVDNKLDESAFANVSGTFLTAHQDLSDYQTIAGMTAYQEAGDYYSASNPSGFITGVDLTPYYTTADANSLSSMLSGAIDYVSANAGNQEVSNVVQTNSSTWNNVTAKQNTLTFRYGTSSGSITSINGSAIVDDYTYHMLNVTRNYTASMNKVLTANSAKWNQVTAKLNTTAFSTVSGDFLTTSFGISESGSWNEATDVVENNSAAWFDNVGDVEVNSFVYTNSSTILDVDTTYQSNSASYLTAHQDISNKLDTTAFSTVSGDFLTAINITESATWNDVSTTVQSNSAQWADGGTGDEEVNSFVYDNSATILDVDTTYQENSASYLTAHQDISNKLDTTAFSTVSGDFLTAHQSLDGYATEDWVTAQGYITGVDLSEYAKTSSVLDYIDSACSSKLDTTSFSNVSGDFLTTSFGISESAHWEEATNAYEQASGTYLTSHQSLDGYATEDWVTGQGYLTGVSIPESATWQDVSTTVQTNSAQWADGGTGDEEVNSFVYDNSATINEVNTTYQQNSANYLTAHQSLDGYATTAEVDTLSSMLSGAIDYVSANASGSSVISSYTTTWSHDVPPYGSHVINSLNGLYISSFLSHNANNAGFANNANSASSAGYAQTVNINYVENEGFVRNLSSEYGTISVIHNNLIESTNSAVLRTGYEGFVSSFGTMNIGPYGSTATFSWDKSLPNTKFTGSVQWPTSNTTIHYSADTNLTGEILAPHSTETTFSIDIPNVTALNFSADQYIAIANNVASAADTFETTVGELAWASALPIYEYNSSNKISAINGSAIAAGDEFPASANEAITAYQNASGTYLTAISIPESATWNDVSTTVQTNSSNWDNVSNKLDTTAFSDVSGTFLTAVDLSPYSTTAEVDSISSMLSASIDYVSANAVDEFPASADEAIQYVQTNSGTIDDTVTSYKTNSGTFLTAHQAISAEEWNDCYDNVNTNSGAWGGSALPISAGPGIGLSMVDGVLVISVTGGD